MYAQICDCNINLNLVAKDISQFSNAAAEYAPPWRHRRHRKAQHNAQSQRHSDCVQKIRENLIEYVRILGVSPNFEIAVICGLKFHWYLRTLCLKFQRAGTKIENFLPLPCWLSQFSWDSQLGRDRKTPILVLAFWNFKFMPYPCSHFYFDIKFGDRLYSKEKRWAWPVLFWI